MSEEEVRSEKLYPITNYTNIIWHNLSQISALADDRPEKAYGRLRYLIPLLPTEVKEALKPVNEWFEGEAEKTRNEIFSSYSDKSIATYMYWRRMRSLIKQYIARALDIISNKMEEIGLKWFVAGFRWRPFDGGSVRRPRYDDVRQ